MSRHPQKNLGARGSLKWMQRAVHVAPDLLQPAGLPRLSWVSPLADDDYAEYGDAGFLERIGLAHLSPSLSEFWPRRGPQWDGLATFEGGSLIAEAKAHLGEFKSSPSKAKKTSKLKIARAFDQVQTALGVTNTAPWERTYYQYANRIAHLWWLRSRGVDCHLLFVDFIGDHDVRGPDKASEWRAAFATADAALGLDRAHALGPFIHHVHPDIRLM